MNGKWDVSTHQYTDLHGQLWQFDLAEPSLINPDPIKDGGPFSAHLVAADNIYQVPTDRKVVTGDGPLEDAIALLDDFVATYDASQEQLRQAKVKEQQSGSFWLLIAIVAALVLTDKKKR